MKRKLLIVLALAALMIKAWCGTAAADDPAFITQPGDGCIFPEGETISVSWEVNFTPFKTEIVLDGQVLETLPLETYRTYSELFDETLFEAIDLKNCMEKRISEGGTSVASVEKQIAFVRKELDQ